MEALGPFLIYALFGVALYMLFIRPARARSRAALQMQQQLGPGVEVMTTSGIFGSVVAVEDDVLLVEVAPGVRLRFAKAAVGLSPGVPSSSGMIRSRTRSAVKGLGR